MNLFDIAGVTLPQLTRARALAPTVDGRPDRPAEIRAASVLVPSSRDNRPETGMQAVGPEIVVPAEAPPAEIAPPPSPPVLRPATTRSRPRRHPAPRCRLLPDPGAPVLCLSALQSLIETDPTLTGTRRRDQRSALKALEQIARAHPDLCGHRAPAVLPIDAPTLNTLLFSQPTGTLGLTRDRSTRTISTLRQILRQQRRLAPEAGGLQGLVPAWRALADRLPGPYRQAPLMGFMDYAGLHGVAPAEAGQSTLEAYDTWLRRWTLDRDITGKVRRTAGAWEWARAHLPAWPQAPLIKPQRKEVYTPRLTDLPASFQADVAAFIRRQSPDLDDIFRDPLDDDTAPVAPSSPSPRRGLERPLATRTINHKQSLIRACAAALGANGVPLGTLTGLRDLVVPADRPVMILRWHRNRRGDRLKQEGKTVDHETLRSPWQQGMAELLVQIARYHCRLDAAAVEGIARLARNVRPRQQVEMTGENRKQLAALTAPGPCALLLNLPGRLMREADAARGQGRQMEGALLARTAVALDILLQVAIRRKNLVQLDLVRHFQRLPGGVERPDRLVIPGREVKNRRGIDFTLPPELADRIAHYVRHHRPVLCTDPANTFLFPGRGTSPLNLDEFGTRFSALVSERIGVVIHMHLIRHFVGWLYLSSCPGEYEVVRQMLGHASIETTRRFYLGLETEAAARRVQATVLAVRQQGRNTAARISRGKPGAPKWPRLAGSR